MMNFGRSAIPLVTVLLLSRLAHSGWWDVWQAGMEFDLERARSQALETIAEDPNSADAVAAASWWLANIEDIQEPEEILAMTGDDRDPELGFMLERVASVLGARPPAGALTDAELAGAFGVFSTLDLERDVAPQDSELPPLGTRWFDPAEPFRLLVRTGDGLHGPPRSMIADGVFLVSWTLEVAEDATGWMVIEAQGGFNLEVDGQQIDRRRNCGLVDPGTSWYRIALGRGAHRIRIEVASPDRPQVRLSLLDDQGARLRDVQRVDEAVGTLTNSEVIPMLPPASRALHQRLQADNAAVADLLLASQLARGRGDPEDEYRWIERARAVDTEDPWVALALARYYLREDVGRSGSEHTKTLTGLLREANAIPGSQLFARAVAIRHGRNEDAERILDELITDYPEDSRVLRLWIRESVRRGWVREAEEGLSRLEAELPGSLAVTDLRLEVLASLERWQERQMLLGALAVATPVEPRWISDMASGCLLSDAVAATVNLSSEIEDPDFDVQLVQLLLEAGDYDKAREKLTAARERWGDLRVFDELALLLAADNENEVETVLTAALERDPSNLQFLTLSWRGGQEPFFAPFAVDARDFVAKYRDLGEEVDAVLLLDQAVEKIFADGSSLYYYHGVTRANTPVGARRASTLQPLPDAYLLTVRVLKPDGGEVIPSEIQPGQTGVVLSDVEPGDVVEEEYVAWVGPTGATRDGHLPPYIYRFADPDRAFGLSEYILLVPPTVDLQVDGNFEGLEQSEREWRGLRMLRWRAENVPPMPIEPFAPPAQDLMPWLNYGFGVTWQDVGDAVRDRLLEVMLSSPELREWSRTFLVGETAHDQVESLVGALVETVESGDSDVIVGETAAESFNRRRGNRLGIVATVLAEAGWDVNFVMTRPWTDRGQRLDMPTLDAFPAALLRATWAGETVWFDSREERRGVNHVHPLFQGSDGLVLPLTKPREPVTWIDEIPSFSNPDLVEEMRVRAVVNAEGLAHVDVAMPLRGGQGTRLLERMESIPQNQVEMLFRQIALSLFPGADEVAGYIDEDEPDDLLRLDITIPGACAIEDGFMVCRSLVLGNPLVPSLARLPERTYPLVLRMPIERRLTLDLVPPSDWRVVPRPPRRLDAEWGSVGESLEDRDGSQLSVLRLLLPKQTIPPDSYRDFARFCQAVDELTTRPPRMEPRPSTR